MHFILLHYSRPDGFIALNRFHQTWLDYFFIYYTNVGDGLFTIAVILLLLLFKKFNFAWAVLASFLLSGLISQVLKYNITSPRPKQFFQPGTYPYFFDGITHVGVSSFPSGHSASIFALATICALYIPNKLLTSLFLLAAYLVGYSRIYLGQHFPGDVFSGAIIGVVAAMATHIFFLKRKNRPAKL